MEDAALEELLGEKPDPRKTGGGARTAESVWDAAVRGKGAPEGWEAVIRPGRILYEMQGVSREMALEALRLAAHKLAVKTKFIERSDSI